MGEEPSPSRKSRAPDTWGGPSCGRGGVARDTPLSAPRLPCPGSGGAGRAGTVPKDTSPRSLVQEFACLCPRTCWQPTPLAAGPEADSLLGLPSWKTAPPAPMGPRGPRAAGVAATETPSGGGRPGSKARGLAGGLAQQLPLHSSGHQACAAGVSSKIPSGSPSPRGWNPRAEAGTRSSSQRAGGLPGLEHVPCQRP